VLEGFIMRTTGVALMLAASAILAACGGGGGGGGSTPTSPSPSPGGGGGGTQTTVTINIVGVKGKLSFSPNPATIQAGQLVVFKNNDIVTHHVMLDDNSLQTTDIAPGATSAALPIGAANVAYHCNIHPSMVGSFNAAATPEPEPCTGYCG
jgi:plastocyanin